MKLTLLALVMAGLAVPCIAEDRKDIDSVVQKFAKGFRDKNMTAVEAVTTADFCEKGPKGEKMDTKGTKALYRQMWSMMKQIDRLEFKQEKIMVKGSTAEAVYKVTMSAVMPNPSNTAETQKMTSTGTSQLWLVRQKGGWKIRMSAHTPDQHNPPKLKG